MGKEDNDFLDFLRTIWAILCIVYYITCVSISFFIIVCLFFIITFIILLVLIAELTLVPIVFMERFFYILLDFFKFYTVYLKQNLPDACERRKIGIDQPAYRMYFFRDLFISLSEIINDNSDKEHFEYVFEFGIKLIEKAVTDLIWSILLGKDFELPLPLKVLIWILKIPITLSKYIAIFIGALICLIVITIHNILVLVCTLSILSFTKMLNCLEKLNMTTLCIFMACPSCYNKFSRPICLCPNCNEEHSNLAPGKYGILKRKCECDHLLQTLFFNGKNMLPRKCPICGHQLVSDIGVLINNHYSIVGGKSSGKSCFLKASMILMSELSTNSFDISFPDKRDNIIFEKSKKFFEIGMIPSDITSKKKQRAFLSKVRPNKRRFSLKSSMSHLIYVYEDRRLTYEDNDPETPNEYYEYINGIFFIIDPFSIHTIKTKYSQKITNFFENTKPSPNSPIDVFNYIVQSLEEKVEKKNSSSKNRKYKIPIAVIITKSDVLGLDIDQSSESVRDWLHKQTQQENLVPNLESKFTDVKYFSCSSFGHMPLEVSKFTPKGINEIWDWMLSFKKVLN